MSADTATDETPAAVPPAVGVPLTVNINLPTLDLSLSSLTETIAGAVREGLGIRWAMDGWSAADAADASDGASAPNASHLLEEFDIDNPDAMHWALHFCRAFSGQRVSQFDNIKPDKTVNPGLMVGWFANYAAAIERRERRKRASAETSAAMHGGDTEPEKGVAEPVAGPVADEGVTVEGPPVVAIKDLRQLEECAVAAYFARSILLRLSESALLNRADAVALRRLVDATDHTRQILGMEHHMPVPPPPPGPVPTR